MGQAKQRGTYEQRKALAEERNRAQTMLNVEPIQRRPSRRIMAFMAITQGMSLYEDYLTDWRCPPRWPGDGIAIKN